MRRPWLLLGHNAIEEKIGKDVQGSGHVYFNYPRILLREWPKTMTAGL
jgi:hypothetical protein